MYKYDKIILKYCAADNNCDISDDPHINRDLIALLNNLLLK